VTPAPYRQHTAWADVDLSGAEVARPDPGILPVQISGASGLGRRSISGDRSNGNNTSRARDIRRANMIARKLLRTSRASTDHKCRPWDAATGVPYRRLLLDTLDGRRIVRGRRFSTGMNYSRNSAMQGAGWVVAVRRLLKLPREHAGVGDGSFALCDSTPGVRAPAGRSVLLLFGPGQPRPNWSKCL
jgi:hypothetical protein